MSFLLFVYFCIVVEGNFVLVAKPTIVTCYFTRILPGLSFAMVYGALVTKTNRIARILEGTKKIITKKPRFMSASSQVIITCILVGIYNVHINISMRSKPSGTTIPSVVVLQISRTRRVAG
jgi:hypothetical protein